jgi:hypothetical protein
MRGFKQNLSPRDFRQTLFRSPRDVYPLDFFESDDSV